MIQIQVAPREGGDAYRLLRSKVLHEAATWYWANKAKTRLKHKNPRIKGHIEVANAGGVIVARVVPKAPSELFYLAEKFMGRLVGWFETDLSAINVQLSGEKAEPQRRRRRGVKRRRVAKRRRTSRKRR
jgi:hypothetical protein